MKTHLINILYRKGLLLVLLIILGGWGKVWGQQYNLPSWAASQGTVYYDNGETTRVTLTQNVTLTGSIIVSNGSTLIVEGNGSGNWKIIRDSSFTGKMFSIGGGGRVLKIEGTSTHPITIDGNNVAADYAAIDDRVKGTQIVLDYVTIQNNYSTAQSGSGAIYTSMNTTPLTTVSINHCNIINNSSKSIYGGAIYCLGSLTIANSTISGNTIYYSGTSTTMKKGGGIYCRDLTLSGEVHIIGNKQKYGESSYPNQKDDNLVFYDKSYYITIATDGLTCGSEVGVGSPSPSTFNVDDSHAWVVAKGTGTNAIDNCAKATSIITDDEKGCLVCNWNISPYTNNNVYFVKTHLYYAQQAVSPDDYVIDASNNTLAVITYKGLDYVAKQVYEGNKDYEGWTIRLNNDLNIIPSQYWIPIGVRYDVVNCSDLSTQQVSHPFKGHFDGQGHTIKGPHSKISVYDMGLFGYVEGGTIENVILLPHNKSTYIYEPKNCTSLGGIVGYLHGGTVSNCEAAVTLTGGSGTIVGGLVGKADSYTVSGTTYASTIHSCCTMPTFDGGGTVGGLVGQLASGCSLKNSFSNTASGTPGLVGSNAGTVNNCYVRTTTSFIGSGTAVTNCYALGSATGNYTATSTPYLYNHADNQVVGANMSLLDKLNAGRESGHTEWTRTMASPINGDYPILKYTAYNNCVGSTDNRVLQYGTDLNTLMTNITDEAGHNIFLYDNATGVTAGNTNRGVYIAEDVAIIHTSTIKNAHVGITLDPTNGSEGVHWHMFSPALSNAPLGINYTDNIDWPFSLTHPSGMPYYLFTQKSESNDTYGYFPSHSYGQSYPANNNNLTDAGNAGNYYTHWDFYTYYEPKYHWINFKRNGNSHHHEDSEHEHIDYHWDNNTSNSTSLNINEPTLVRGKGYLVATDHECFLEAKGTLNQGSFTIPVTTQGAYRTGYNFLGNPYQSYFDFDKFAYENRALWGGTQTNASYIILNKDGYTYYAYSGSDNQITTSANRYLHPHQGFMIVATNSGTATFTNDMRNTTATTPFREDHINYPLVNLIVTEEDGNRDITTIELGRPEAGGAFKQYDMHLGKGCIYTHYEDADYAIAFTLPGLSEIGIRFETDEDATYTLTWDMENGEFHYLHLIDNLTGIDIDCLTTTEYRFKAKASDYKSRFKIVFEYTGVEENEDGPSTGSGTFAFIMGNELVVNGEGYFQMFDLAGRLVMTETMSGTQTTAVLPDVPTGVYVIRLTNKKGTRVQKMVIEN